jgi:SAM-dependent MidA family methyltransferase
MTAPNFMGDYPMAGELIGPAWQAMWDALGDGRELTTRQLCEIGCGAGIVEGTAKHLLRAARRAGKLRVVYPDPRPGHQRAIYSRP